MSEMVRKVARAIHEARIALCWGKSMVGVRDPWPDFSDPVVTRSYPHNPIAYVDIAMEQARVAIAAMREPTEAMVLRSRVIRYGDLRDKLDKDTAATRWRRMIEAALADG